MSRYFLDPGTTLAEPDFAGAGRVHDWRNYVTKRVRDAWPGLSDEVRDLIADMAQKAADAEEWD